MSTQNNLSLTRILAELKIIGTRIQQASQEPFVALCQGVGNQKRSMIVNHSRTGFQVVTSPTPAEVETQLIANLQSVKDLLTRQRKLKAALVMANAVTTVQIGSETITIAEAIERKASLPLRQQLLNQLKQQYTTGKNFSEQEQAKLDLKIQQQLDTLFGKDKKADESQVDLIRTTQEAQFKPGMIDPCNIADEIKKLETEIQTFQLNIDFALSEVNANTKVAVD